MGMSDAVIAGRCCIILIDAKACVGTHATRASLARRLARLITRLVVFKLSPDNPDKGKAKADAGADG